MHRTFDQLNGEQIKWKPWPSYNNTNHGKLNVVFGSNTDMHILKLIFQFMLINKEKKEQVPEG